MGDQKKHVAIGIDLGTTYSCVGYWNTGTEEVKIIANDQGNYSTPSYVAFGTEEGRLIGEAAHDQAWYNTTNTIFDSKRLIGRRFIEETVQNDIKLWPFKVIAGSDNTPLISVTCSNGEKKEFTPQQISAMVLGELKTIAEDSLGSEVKDAVITVPAYFDQSQRQATIDAGKIAGLNVLRLINEPTAAAITYGLDCNVSTITGKKNFLVFDLGGGTFDVSCLAITKDKIEVKAVGGDSHLGGQDFDNRMVEHFVEVVKTKYKKDISKHDRAKRRLKTECEKGKRLLSKRDSATVSIPALCDGVDFKEKITRSKFEELNSDLFEKCIKCVEKCLMDAEMDKKDVDEVVLVGGSSRIVKIQEMLSELMNGKELYKRLNPDEAITRGAAVQAALLSGQGSKKIEKLVLRDVIPLSLGVETKGVLMRVLIPRNTAIPTRVVKNFTTNRDYQTAMGVRVIEGERVLSKDNTLLGELTLKGIKPALRGEVSVEVCFDLQADGMLDVSAKDRSTGREISTTIKDVKFSGEEIQKMIKEASEYKASDEMYRIKAEARDDFKYYICGLRNELKVKSRRVKADEKKKAENAVEEAFKWLDSRKQLAEISEYEEEKKYLMSVMDEARKTKN